MRKAVMGYVLPQFMTTDQALGSRSQTRLNSATAGIGHRRTSHAAPPCARSGRCGGGDALRMVTVVVRQSA